MARVLMLIDCLSTKNPRMKDEKMPAKLVKNDEKLEVKARGSVSYGP